MRSSPRSLMDDNIASYRGAAGGRALTWPRSPRRSAAVAIPAPPPPPSKAARWSRSGRTLAAAPHGTLPPHVARQGCDDDRPCTTMPEDAITRRDGAPHDHLWRHGVMPVVDRQCALPWRGGTRVRVRQALAPGLADAPVQTCLQTALYTATPDDPVARDRSGSCACAATTLRADPDRHSPSAARRSASSRAPISSVAPASRMPSPQRRSRAQGATSAQTALPLARRPVQGVLRARLPRLALQRAWNALGGCADTHAGSRPCTSWGAGCAISCLASGHRGSWTWSSRAMAMAFAQALAQREGARLTTHGAPRHGRAPGCPEGRHARGWPPPGRHTDACPVGTPPRQEPRSLQHDLDAA